MYLIIRCYFTASHLLLLEPPRHLDISYTRKRDFNSINIEESIVKETSYRQFRASVTFVSLARPCPPPTMVLLLDLVAAGVAN